MQARLGVALLVDGENLSHQFAGRILQRARKEGVIAVGRVYGDIARIPGWAETPGFQFIHLGNRGESGANGRNKNSADMMLTIDAMDLAHSGNFGTLILATSDGDFSDLAHYLRARHFKVIGHGELEKATNRLREAYTVFVVLPSLKKTAPVEMTAAIASSAESPCEGLDELDAKLHELIRTEADGLLVNKVNGLIRCSLDLKISKLPDKN